MSPKVTAKAIRTVTAESIARDSVTADDTHTALAAARRPGTVEGRVAAATQPRRRHRGDVVRTLVPIVALIGSPSVSSQRTPQSGPARSVGRPGALVGCRWGRA